MARKFLYAVAGAVLLMLAGLLGLRFWARQLSELAFITWCVFIVWIALGSVVYLTYGRHHSKLAATN